MKFEQKLKGCYFDIKNTNQKGINMIYNFENKVVFVTGSSRGIGRAIALNFARSRAKLAINASSSRQELAKTLGEIKAENPNAMGLIGDVSDYKQCENMIKQIKNNLGDIDILINNAGISHIGLFTDMHHEEIKRIMDININGAMNCSHLVLSDMIKKKKGCIINISSMWGNVGASCEVVYSASKGALNLFTKALAKELAPSGIRVNAVACGAVNTQMNDILSSEDKAELIDKIPMMRFAEPDEIAKTVMFLACDDASYITGQVVTLDGAMN